jgi:hypothetical protein
MTMSVVGKAARQCREYREVLLMQVRGRSGSVRDQAKRRGFPGSATSLQAARPFRQVS